jgi:hypothetical protein
MWFFYESFLWRLTMKSCKILCLCFFLLAPALVKAEGAPNTKQVALEQLWVLSEKISPVSENSIDRYQKLIETDPDRFQLENPQVRAFVADAMRRRWIHSMDASFSEKEIGFLIKLYSSQTYQKLGGIESAIWNKKDISTLTEISIQQAIQKFKLKPVNK